MSINSYQGKAFDPADLKYLPRTFAEAYRSAIETHGHQAFVVTYGDTGLAERKSFAEFARDVETARAFVSARRGAASIGATLGENTYQHLVFIAAILLEGLTLCPLAPGDTATRISGKLGSIGSPVVVFGEGALASLISPEFSFVPMEQLAHRPQDPPSDFRLRKAADPFILIFTSGSTGYSKIVEQLEENILANVDALIERHRLGPDEAIGTSMPVHHVNALEFSFFCSLFSGAKLVLLKKFRVETFLRAVADEGITIFSLFPQIISQLLLQKKELLAAELHSLKYVVSAAAPLSPGLAQEFYSTFSFRLIQGYGLSEAVNFSALMPTGLPQDAYRHWLLDFERPSIGTPLRGNDLYVLGENDEELGPNQTGEICVRGHNVTRGYRGDSERKIFAGNYLHTGDRGFYVPDPAGEKFFFITGRSKDIAKRFGKTISLVELDDILLDLAPIKAIAVPFPHSIAGEEIAAVIELAGADSITPDQIKNVFRNRLPAEEQPKVALLTTQPVRTASGKACRWQFIPRFREFSGKLFGTGILLLDDR